MEVNRPTLVLFPGAWGNRTDSLVRWWFRHVIRHFADWNIIVLTYEGKTVKDYLRSAEQQLKEVEGPLFAICYSMGAVIARGVSARMPGRFVCVALISGLERIGVRAKVLMNGLRVVFWPLIRTLILKPLIPDNSEQVERLFLSGPMSMSKRAAALEIFSKMTPESARAILALAVPGLRQTQPRFTCPVMAIVPRDDFFFPDQGDLYRGEDVVEVRSEGAHGLICTDRDALHPQLQRIHRFFATHL